MLDITCRSCGSLYHADLAHLGKRLKCTQCSSMIVIEKQQTAPSRVAADGARPRQQSPDATPKPKVLKLVTPE